jgi:hypothetical protein
MDLNKTLGIIGTPHEESIAMILSTKTCQIKRNRRNPTKNSSNPRTPLNSRIWEGNQRQNNHEGFTRISPIKSPRARSRKHTEKITKRGMRKSPPRTIGNNTTKPWGTTPNHLYILLMDKRRIPLRSASARTPYLFHHGIPKVLVNPQSKGITSV